jgi:hypothetical protein
MYAWILRKWVNISLNLEREKHKLESWKRVNISLNLEREKYKLESWKRINISLNLENLSGKY